MSVIENDGCQSWNVSVITYSVAGQPVTPSFKHIFQQLHQEHKSYESNSSIIRSVNIG